MNRKALKQKILEFDKHTPTLPKGFEAWAKKELKNRNRMMFYKKTKNKSIAVCSSCGTIQEPKAIEHNKEIRCQACKKKAMAKSINKARGYSARDFFTVAQPFKSKDAEGIIVRYFSMSLTYKKDNTETEHFPNWISPKLTAPEYDNLWEGSRVYMIKDKKTQMERKILAEQDLIWENTHSEKRNLVLMWMPERGRSWCFNKELLRDKNALTYKRNLKAIEKGEFKYSGLSHFKDDRFHIEDYLETYKDYKEIEMLSKLGHVGLVKSVIYSSYYQNGHISRVLQEFKHIDRHLQKVIKENGWGTSRVEFILDTKALKTSPEHYKWIFENISNRERFLSVLDHCTITKAINYLSKQKGDIDRSLVSWTDYIFQCKQLELNLKDEYHLFPKNLEEKHAEYTAKVKARKSAEFSRLIKAQHKRWSPIMDWQVKNLEIRLAKNGAELVKEGKAMKHCVGGGHYHERIAKGESLILFIRKDGKPYHTLEFKPNEMKVGQLRAHDNEDPKEDAIKFVEKWLNQVKWALENKKESKKVEV